MSVLKFQYGITIFSTVNISLYKEIVAQFSLNASERKASKHIQTNVNAAASLTYS
jgi:hypothetical protein